MKLIDLKQLQELYTVEGARTVFERLTALTLQNSGKDIKSIRVQRGDGGVDSFEGDYGEEITVFQCKYFVGNIDKAQKEQIQNSFKVALNNKSFILKNWVLCLPKNLSETEQVWFSNFKKTYEKDDISIDYIGENFYIKELLKDKNKELRNHIFKDQYELILARVEEALNRLNSKQKEKHDKKLFYTVIDELDEEFFLNFLASITTYSSYTKGESTQIDKFLSWSQRPSNCFVDVKVEKKYRKFIAQLRRLRIFMSINFFKRHNSLDIKDMDFHLYPDYNPNFGLNGQKENQIYEKYYDELSDVCEEVNITFQKFIKKAKK